MIKLHDGDLAPRDAPARSHVQRERVVAWGAVRAQPAES
jgi:hypothetical protein